MILTEKINILITNKNIRHYTELGYIVKSGNIVDVYTKDLPRMCKRIIEVECDVCKEKYNITYYSYTRNISNYGFYSCKKCCSKKNIMTHTILYGVEYNTQRDDVKEKTINTNREKYGVDYALQAEEVKNKSLESCREKYGVDYYTQTEEFKERFKNTCISTYGVDHPQKSDIVKNKTKETNKEKYGTTTPFKNDIIKEKISETKFIKYNDKNYNNRDKYKDTCLENYGYDNPMKSEDILIRQQLSVYETYGVYHPAQHPDIYEKMIKSGYHIHKYKETDIYYQSSYEKDFLDKYYDIGIIRGMLIEYRLDDKEKIYYPDFYLEDLNLIIEIKSSRWYEQDLKKNLAKQKACIEQGYKFIFIIDKDYTIIDNMLKYKIFKSDKCWQYIIRENTLQKDIKDLNIDKKLHISDFKFEYVDKKDNRCKDIVKFIEKYEWLGKMPNRPTHRFIATYNDIIAGVIILAVPNSFSELLGKETKNIEKLISRGACASWTPKNLASSLLMWSINWMVKNTEFRVFTAYSDPEANEIGTIYQACNFIYLGQESGSDKLYFDINNNRLGWTTGRNFRKLSFYKKLVKNIGIQWNIDWEKGYSILWNNMPNDIEYMLKTKSKELQDRCIVRKCIKKHKYVYILGKDKKETNQLLNKLHKDKKEYPKRNENNRMS